MPSLSRLRRNSGASIDASNVSNTCVPHAETDTVSRADIDYTMSGGNPDAPRQGTPDAAFVAPAPPSSAHILPDAAHARVAGHPPAGASFASGLPAPNLFIPGLPPMYAEPGTQVRIDFEVAAEADGALPPPPVAVGGAARPGPAEAADHGGANASLLGTLYGSVRQFFAKITSILGVIAGWPQPQPAASEPESELEPEAQPIAPQAAQKDAQPGFMPGAWVDDEPVIQKEQPPKPAVSLPVAQDAQPIGLTPVATNTLVLNYFNLEVSRPIRLVAHPDVPSALVGTTVKKLSGDAQGRFAVDGWLSSFVPMGLMTRLVRYLMPGVYDANVPRMQIDVNRLLAGQTTM